MIPRHCIKWSKEQLGLLGRSLILSRVLEAGKKRFLLPTILIAGSIVLTI